MAVKFYKQIEEESSQMSNVYWESVTLREGVDEIDQVLDALAHTGVRKRYDVNLGTDYGSHSVVRETPDGNLVSSESTQPGEHLPVIDLDIPHRLVPSSTPGHSHLYIDKPVTWEQYKHLLEALLECGIIGQGWFNQAMLDGKTWVRAPDWTKEREARERRGTPFDYTT